MASVSDELRAAREQAGLTLADVADRTKIKLSMLQAIEAGDFDRLPGPFFARAFVRSYARELGLPMDEIAKRYVDAVEPRAPEPPPLPQAQAAPPWWATSLRPRPVLAAVAIVLVAMLFQRAGRSHDAAQPGTPGAVGTSGVVEASAAPSVPPVPAGPARGEPMVLEIRPTAPTWVSATADGKRVVYRELRAGEQTTLKARDEIALRIGNAAAFDYSINGAPGRRLGAEGEPRNARITRETIPSFRR